MIRLCGSNIASMRLWRRDNPRPAVSFTAFGVPVDVTLSDPELEPLVLEILPPGWSRCQADATAGQFEFRQTEDDAYEVDVFGVRHLEHATLDVALALLDAQIRLYIAAYARDCMFVHAGVVVRDGGALVLPGESFSGKSTLVGALVQAGATYYSDEYAVLDEDGLVHPYLRPLSIRSGDGFTERRRVLAELDGVAGDDDRASLAAVVFTSYRSGAEWEPKRISRGQGLTMLLAHAVPARARPDEALRTLRRAIAGATVLEGDRGEARSVATALLDELATAVR